MTNDKKSAYSKSGVDIDAKMELLRRAKKKIAGTRTAGSAGEWGLFGGLFQSPGKDHLLVSSTDGVGTKLKVAHMVGRHDTVGQDIVNHCVNDILAQGAEPLFFLDYIGAQKLDPGIFAEVIEGLCKACRENNCALVGGETAEMPGLYPAGEYDLVGTIVGAVPKKRLITGTGVKSGDVLIGLPSSGLHTNGYSLARRTIFEKAGKKVSDILPGTKKTFGEALLAVHRSYLKPVRKLMDAVKLHAVAHITGGGFVDNIDRFLPKGLCAVVDRSTWSPLPIFQFIQQAGKVDRDEMYKVFNMGIGLVLFVARADAEKTVKLLRAAGEKPVAVGYVEKGPAPVRLIG
ncbi:MAG: phosphoribosylformylglycinamidine cyclo-ligase [Verrucomicrobia bacterium]|nr:MAG: phosphoribosylformylglycinamidine cyclo-ligase [Verrucomicrobiota bacterium]